MATGTGGSRKYRAGDVAFVEQADVLKYWPAKSSTVIQCVGAVGIAVLSFVLAILVWSMRPLRGLLDDGGWMNSVATVCLFASAGLLLLAVPIYLRGTKTRFSLEKGSTILRHGQRTVVDFQGATAVTIEDRRVGKAGDIFVYSVALTGGKKPASLPLLTFELREEAQRVADNISVVLELPVL